ncbi:hypothetical protein CXB51_028501 [Gossypium anomalum]|uniref:Uncharacterized protein n=1 Tax=Gossypium anomalum TaxID=47600 RepID=A0A8J6CPM8_9ROSI|nr:hypothetical protein CXB51_028501 [Gossypium anomalum]
MSSVAKLWMKLIYTRVSLGPKKACLFRNLDLPAYIELCGKQLIQNLFYPLGHRFMLASCGSYRSHRTSPSPHYVYNWRFNATTLPKVSGATKLRVDLWSDSTLNMAQIE